MITPYRQQIRRIQGELEKSSVTGWQDIRVDTVERFQGSQRRVILVSFAVNTALQLRFLTSNLFRDHDTGEEIDRKLNVTLTRAKEQLILIGNRDILSRSKVFADLIEYIRSRRRQPAT